MCSRGLCVLGILVLFAAPGRSQSPAGDQPAVALSKVRSAVELVRLDFLALADGQLVSDLSPGEVTLKIDGRPREIRSFQFVRLGASTAAGRPVAGRLPPPFGTNALDDAGRTILIIFETDSIRANVAQQATLAAAEFVAALSPRDWVGVITAPYGGILVEPTRDHERVLKVLPAISGQASQQTSDSEKSCRTRNTLNALADHLRGIAHLEGPKTVVVVSSGMALPRRDAPMAGPPGPCELRSEHFQEVGSAAVISRTNLFVVKPDDFVIDSAKNAFVDPTASRFRSSDEELAGIESLAGVTNGQLLRLTPTDRSAFARIARESAGYYLVGFEPTPGERNGSYRRVEFGVARAGVRVRVHPTLMIPKPDGKRLALTPQAMLRDARAYRDLPLRVVAVTAPNPGDTKLRIVAILEAPDLTGAASDAGLESAAFGLIDGRGRLVAQWTANARELTLTPAMSAGLASPGRYRLRAAAIDSTGRRGAADYEFVAEPFPAGSLTLSAMVLGVAFQKTFLPKLQYVKEPTAAGQFEIFGVPPAGALTVAMELAHTEDGQALVRVPGAIVATSDPQRQRATGVVPVGNLAPGDYVMRAVLSLDGAPIGRITRVLRKAS